jgi:hypothetical protein
MHLWVNNTTIRRSLGNIPQWPRFLRRLLTITMAFLTPVVASANVSPVIDSITISPEAVTPGSLVTLTLQAHDPDCSGTCDDSGCGTAILSTKTSWRTNAGNGQIMSFDPGVTGSPYVSTAEWLAPDVEGTYTVYVDLYDNGSFACGRQKYFAGSIDITVAEITSEPPVIQSVTANPSLLYPDEQSQLGCVATDPEGEALTYDWITTNGTVVLASGGSATFTAGSPGITTVTCTATDPAGVSASDTVNISVIGAEAERSLTPGLVTPQRLDVTSWGDLFVADRSAGGLVAVNLLSGELVYRLALADVTSVAVDWNDDLLTAASDTARVLNRRGDVLLTLEPGENLGRISDVAVDSVNRRYGVLYRKTGRVVVFDQVGSVLAAFGSTGDGGDQLKSPHGLAAAPDGTWLIGDSGHGQVKRFNADGALLATFGDHGAGVGEFMQIDDVAVDDAGVIYVSDSFQDWIVAYNPDGSLRESFGTYGDGVGEFKTASGVVPASDFDRLVATSLNGSSIEIFKTTRNPVTVAPAPVASLSTTALSFNSQTVGTASPSKIVNLTNQGDAPLGIRGVVIDPNFRQTNDCELFLDPGQSCGYTVVFVPNRPGVINGTMVVDTSAADAPVEVSLSGLGTTPPMVALSPPSLAFSGIYVGKTSAPQIVTLTNAGTDLLMISGIGVTGDYSLTSTCGGTLAGGASCTIAVVFAPLSFGDHLTGILSVVSNAAGSPHLVALDGASLPADAALTIADATEAEGDGNPATARFAVTMTGSSAGTVTVEYVTTAGTATEDEDYYPVSGTLTFPDGVTRRTVSVPIIDDDILEPDEEYFRVELRNPVNATINRSRGTGTIVDDELCPSPNLLLNPDAEERLPGGGIPGWQAVEGDWRLNDSEPDPFEGVYAFAAGTAEYSELQQTIDVTAFAATIDADAQQFAFEAFIRTGGIDLAAVVVEYISDTGAVLDTFDPGDISSTEAWTRVADFHTAPPFTRQIRVRLIGQRLEDESTNAFFDHIALVSLRIPTIWIDGLTVYEGADGESSEALFAARMACGFFDEVRGWVWTSDGTAVAGMDYVAADEPIVVAPGDIEALVPVTIIGDANDEDHERFDVNLTLDDSPAVTLFNPADGIIYNDDFCGVSPEFWLTKPEMWPVDSLVLGGVEYDSATLLWLLGYSGSDVSHQLARELTATKLNLAVGSDPSIIPTVEAADDFLTRFPPGSQPTGRDKQDGRELVDELIPYNDSGCTPTRRVDGRREYCEPCGD